MKRSGDQNALFHARLRTWATNIVMNSTHGEVKKNTKSKIKEQEAVLKGAAKMIGVLSGLPEYQRLFDDSKDGGTSGLSWHEFHEFFNLVEQRFCQVWPDAYEPLPRDGEWNAQN